MSTVSAVPAQNDADEPLRSAIDAALADVGAGTASDDAVAAAARYALAAGGKRLRPLLCLAAMDAVRAQQPLALRVRAACALELIHTYSLVHDDLPCMDDDDMRRGRATTHRVFGTPAAMAAGFALIPAACRLLVDAADDMGVDAERALEAVRDLCRAAGAAGMVGGQVLDLEAEGADIDAGALNRIHAMKTGALFGSALRIGAVLGGGTAAEAAALGAFGEHLGMAFQITDDVLDVTMDSESLGKTAGKDRDADKTTFASRLGVADARRAAADEVAAAMAELRGAGLQTPVLERLAGFAADRNR